MGSRCLPFANVTPADYGKPRLDPQHTPGRGLTLVSLAPRERPHWAGVSVPLAHTCALATAKGIFTLKATALPRDIELHLTWVRLISDSRQDRPT